jgi:hypothetical protein
MLREYVTIGMQVRVSPNYLAGVTESQAVSRRGKTGIVKSLSNPYMAVLVEGEREVAFISPSEMEPLLEVPLVPEVDNSFFMVYGVGGGAPAVKHTTEVKAETEALRLSKLNPNKEFVVLKAITSIVYKSEPKLIRTKL